MDKATALALAKRFLKYIKSQNYNLTNAYLFGSYANGNPKEESDIDIAIFFEKLEDAIETQIELMKLRRKIDLRIEPHPFASSDIKNHTPFVDEILRTGTVIEF
ncbi:MAG: nucleotidyltransferase domain-containing protein [Candidatus Cloacimonetes bacterium]|nr:nucleotidyltransferase domain-containing protein [Candidatus Cloacimonadota bacterium]